MLGQNSYCPDEACLFIHWHKTYEVQVRTARVSTLSQLLSNRVALKQNPLSAIYTVFGQLYCVNRCADTFQSLQYLTRLARFNSIHDKKHQAINPYGVALDRTLNSRCRNTAKVRIGSKFCGLTRTGG